MTYSHLHILSALIYIISAPVKVRSNSYFSSVVEETPTPSSPAVRSNSYFSSVVEEAPTPSSTAESFQADSSLVGSFQAESSLDVPTPSSPAAQSTSSLDRFAFYPNVAISGFNNLELKNIDLEGCAAECLQQEAFLCKSFDYFGSTCWLSEENSASESLTTYGEDDPYDYYERIDIGPVSFFEIVPNSALPQQNVKEYIGSTLETCAERCINSTLFYCASFEFNRFTDQCFLSNVSRLTANPPIRSDYVNNPYDYYERKTIGTGDLKIFCPSSDSIFTTSTVNYIAPTTENNNPNPSVTCDPPSGSLFPDGVNRVECTASDEFNKTASCNFNITVDTEDPVIECPPDAVISSYELYYPDPKVTDNIGVAKFSCNSLSGVPTQLNFITCTAEDLSGRKAGCFFRISVDTIDPTINCHLSDSIWSTSTVSYTEPIATDGNNSPPSVTCYPPSGSLFPDGVSSSVECIARDQANNTASCRFNVTVDTLDPEITCPSDSIWSTSTVNYKEPIATDGNNSPPSVTCHPPSGSTFSDGVSSVSCTAIDQANNTASCSFDITVDSIDPKITCPSDTIWSTSTVNYKEPIATDGNNPPPSVTCYPPSGSLFPGSVSSVACTASDQANNTASCSFNITVDTIDPKIVCPSSDSIWSTSTVNYKEPISTDSGNPSPTVTCHPPSGSLFPESVSSVACTASDQANNTASCSFNITVDTINPRITCPSDSMVSTPTVNYKVPIATDSGNPPPTVTCHPPSGSLFPEGVSSIACTASDQANNTASCSFNITVDTIDPKIDCPSSDSIWSTSTVNYKEPIATDSGNPHPAVTCHPPSGSLFPEGVSSIACTASDQANNTASCSFNITVDTINPRITCPSDSMVSTSTVNYKEPIATDSGNPPPTVMCHPQSGSLFPEFPESVSSVACTASDQANNTASCRFNVIVDTIYPKIDCPTTDSIWSTSTVNYKEPIATDSGNPLHAVTCHPPSGSLFPEGVSSIACTASDQVNNTASCSFNITVDTINPRITCPSDSMVSTSTVKYKEPIATDSGNPPPTVTCHPPSGFLFPESVSSVACTASDQANNTASCRFNIIVDTIDPKIVCPTSNSIWSTSTVNYKEPIATDGGNPPPAVTCHPPSGSLFPESVSSIACTASDQVNNTASCSFNITVDTRNPRITCPSDSVVSTSTVDYNDAIATDSGNPPPTVTCHPSSGSLFPESVSSVACTASDQVNNTASCRFNITVDTIDPKIVCPSSDSIWSTSTVNYKEPIATDSGNPPPTVTCHPPPGSLFPESVSSVACTASDQANNTASCSFKITVDTTIPVINCPATLNSSFSNVTFEDKIFTDNPDTDSVSCVPESGLFPDGLRDVKCTAKDRANNTDYCSFSLIVDTEKPKVNCPPIDSFLSTSNLNYTVPMATDDTTAPIITCPNDIATEDPSPYWKEPVPTDEFGVKTTECNSQPNTAYPVGSANLITCMAEDYAKNTNSCSFFILIETALTEEIANITLNVTENNVDVVANKLENITESAEVLQPADVVEVSNGLTDIVDINSPNKNVTEAVIDTIDNLFEYLDDNNTALIEASAVILGSLEQQIGTAASDGQNFTEQAENFAVQTSSFSSQALSSDVLFSVNQINENTMQTSACFIDCQKKSDLSIKLPKTILKGLNGTQVNVSFIVFKNDALFPSKTLKSSIEGLTSSVVLAATIYDESLPKEFDDPVELVFNVPKNLSAVNASCVFWDEALRDWSNFGCISNSYEEDKITCQCHHLTNFAVLMFPQTNKPSPVKTFLDVVTIIGCSTSIICLIITLVTILSSKNIRSRQPQKIMINLCVSLLCLYILFILGVDHAKPGNRGCTAVAVLVHYFLLTSASWTLVEAINMYFLFIKVFNLPGNKFLWIASSLAWGAPLLLVIVLSIASTDLYINETYCYINSSKGKLLLAFVILPFSIIIVCNIIIFVMVIRKLFLQASVPGKIASQSGDEKKKRVLNAIAISSLLGLTWIFGFLAFEHAAQLPFLVLFCVFNSFQGAAIFYLFCFRQKECKDIWRSWFRGMTNKMSNTLRRMSVQDTSLFTVTDLSSSQKAETPASISLSVIHT